MKLQKFSFASVAALSLVLFLPVLTFLILYGNNMNYNPDHKIYALVGNKVMLAIVMLVALCFVAIAVFIRKIPYNKRNALVVGAVALAVSVVFYFVNVEIAKCIAFYGGWDCGMVANSARWVYRGEGMGYDDYYYIFSNNVPITWLLNRLYSLANHIPGYPYNPEFIWIQFQCLQHSFALFLMTLTVLFASRRMDITILTLVVNTLVLGLSPWKIIPYTDGSTIAFPVIVIFCYVMYLRSKSKYRLYWWAGSIFCGCVGGLFKASCYVPLIAIVIMEVIRILSVKEEWMERLRQLLFIVMAFVVVLSMMGFCRTKMYQRLGIHYDKEMEISWRGFLYDGLNEETTGACSEGGMQIVREFAGRSLEEREAYEWECITKRIEDKGFVGLLDFFLRKQVMTFNDGTFSWYQEGFFHAWEYEELTDSPWKEALRSFYWQEGENYDWFVTISHGLWLFVLGGIIVCAGLAFWLNSFCVKAEMLPMQFLSVGLLTFVGIFLFLMLFEGRARYLYNNVALLATLSVGGYVLFVDCMCGLFKRLRSRK